MSFPKVEAFQRFYEKDFLSTREREREREDITALGSDND